MKVLLKALTVLCVLLSFHTGYTQRPDQNADNYLRELVNQGKFSRAVLVAQNGNILFCKGYGYADRKKKFSIVRIMNLELVQ